MQKVRNSEMRLYVKVKKRELTYHFYYFLYYSKWAIASGGQQPSEVLLGLPSGKICKIRLIRRGTATME